MTFKPRAVYSSTMASRLTLPELADLLVGVLARERPGATRRYMTTAEAAQYCRYDTPFGLLKARARGHVRAHKRGRTYLWLAEDLDAFLAGGCDDERVVVHAQSSRPQRRTATRTMSRAPGDARRGKREVEELEDSIRRIREIARGANEAAIRREEPSATHCDGPWVPRPRVWDMDGKVPPARRRRSSRGGG